MCCDREIAYSSSGLFGAAVFLAILLAPVCVSEAASAGTAKPGFAGAARALVARVVGADQAKSFVVEIIPDAAGRDVFEIESKGDYARRRYGADSAYAVDA